MRGVVAALVSLSSPAFASPPSSQPATQPASRPADSTKTAADLLTPAQLQQDEQALGWWLGGSGAVALAAGVFASWIASDSPPGRVHDLERATATAFVGLGAAFLVTGIYVMAAKDPGPCETDGTALGAAVWIAPTGVVGRF